MLKNQTMSLKWMDLGSWEMAPQLRTLGDCSSRWPGFETQNPDGSAYLPETPVTGGSEPLQASLGTVSVWCIDIHKSKTLKYVKISILKLADSVIHILCCPQ